MKILTVVGARPQFVKATPVCNALREAGHKEYLIHTGQHYDYEMSQVFFEEMGISKPDLNLQVGSGNHGWQTSQMLVKIEEILLAEKPDYVLVYGDTNSTLAGALAAIKLQIPVAHIESGLRSYNRSMPEEHNRVLTDHCADLLFCPTQVAVDNLLSECVQGKVHLVGDTMFDAVLHFYQIAEQKSRILKALDLQPKQFLLATIHRPYNTDIAANLMNLLSAFLDIGELVIFPVHPRTRAKIAEFDRNFSMKLASSNVQMIDPVGYLDMLTLEKNARLILTDSGGIQKEAFFFNVPCVTLRPETEWVETVQAGMNILAGTNRSQILMAVSKGDWPQITSTNIFGNGSAGKQIVKILSQG